jgi:hypothetical protein
MEEIQQYLSKLQQTAVAGVPIDFETAFCQFVPMVKKAISKYQTEIDELKAQIVVYEEEENGDQGGV